MDKLYNSKNFLIKFVHNNRLNSIAKMIPDKGKFKIFDAGCGEGHLIKKLNSKNSNNLYYGVDVTEIALQKAKKRCPYAEFKIENLLKMNFDNAFFDVIICTEVLEHIIEYERAIEELKRILKKDGFLILTFPNEFLWTISRFFLGRKSIKVPDHVNSFNPNQIKSLVRMKLISQINLPFKLPFFISLGCIMKFKKL